MVLKRHSCLPVRTSKARTTPLVLLWVGTVAPSRMEEPDDHDVPGHGRRRMDADLAGLQIDLLVVALLDADLEVEDAVVAEGVDHRAGLGVELDQADSRSSRR